MLTTEASQPVGTKEQTKAKQLSLFDTLPRVTQKVVDFPGFTTLDVPVEDVLDAAKVCYEVMVLGYDDDNQLRIYSSKGGIVKNVFMLEQAKLVLMGL